MEHFTVNPLLNRASQMAERLHANGPLSVIPIPLIINIITTIINAVMQCRQPQPSPTPSADIKAYVEKKYDATTGKYDDHLLQRMRFQAWAAGMKNHTKLNAEQREALAIESLDEARRGAPETLAAIDFACEHYATITD